jgi:peptide/nickel transport system substrate-binding protein
MKKTLFLLVLVIALVGALTAGCGGTTETTVTTAGPATTAAAPTTTAAPVTTAATAPPTTAAAGGDKYGGTLTVALGGGPQSPGGLPWEYQANDSAPLQCIFEPLFHGDKDSNMVPWLAESYELAEDGLSMTIKLKQGIKFTDGSDFNAEVAVWNMQHMIDNHKVGSWKAVEVVDPYTIKLSFMAWDNTIYNSLEDSPNSWMISKASYDKNGEDYARTHPVGTGAFLFDSFQADASYDVVRNPNYWQKGLPYLDKIHFVMITDDSTKKAALQAGEVDVMELEPTKLVADMSKELKDYTWVGSIFSSNILVFGTKNPDSPCANKKVREALDYAIDREALAAALSYGLWGPTYQIPAPDNGAIYDPKYVYPRPYDPEKAKQLLAEAGFATGLKVTIYSAPIPTDPGIIAAIQGMWKEVGVDCELVYCKLQPEWNDADKANAPGTILFEPMGPMGNYNNGLAFGFNAMMDIWNACWLRTPEYKDLYMKSMSTREYDPMLAKAITDYMTNDASVLAVTGAGKGWMVANKLQGHGFLTRTFCPWWDPEAAYIQK